jgi:hypothetical protein|tara:strand:+ start:1328 stop:1657 length:330 start_codon:yes stop_codon:yes gene_type:complete
MSHPKQQWKVGDFAMIGVEVVQFGEGYCYVQYDGHEFGADPPHLLPCEPPNHGHHGDLDKLLTFLDNYPVEVELRGMTDQYIDGFHDALVIVAREIEGAVAAQGGEPES